MFIKIAYYNYIISIKSTKKIEKFINKNKSLLINLALSLGTLIILIFIAEITLRFFYKPLNSGWGWNDSPRRDLSNEVNDYPNQLGLRGQKIR